MKKTLAMLTLLAASMAPRAEGIDMMAVSARICNTMAGAARTIAETRDKGKTRKEVKDAVSQMEDAPTYLALADMVYDDKKKKPQEFYTSIIGNCMADFIKKMELK